MSTMIAAIRKRINEVRKSESGDILQFTMLLVVGVMLLGVAVSVLKSTNQAQNSVPTAAAIEESEEDSSPGFFSGLTLGLILGGGAGFGLYAYSRRDSKSGRYDDLDFPSLGERANKNSGVSLMKPTSTSDSGGDINPATYMAASSSAHASSSSSTTDSSSFDSGGDGGD